jgi:hypothetical protein
MLESSTEESGSSIRVAAVVMRLLICTLDDLRTSATIWPLKSFAASFCGSGICGEPYGNGSYLPFDHSCHSWDLSCFGVFLKENKFGFKSALFDPRLAFLPNETHRTIRYSIIKINAIKPVE